MRQAKEKDSLKVICAGGSAELCLSLAVYREGRIGQTWGFHVGPDAEGRGSCCASWEEPPSLMRYSLPTPPHTPPPRCYYSSKPK